MCGIHITLGHLNNRCKTARCFKNTEMRLRRKDVEVASRCAETKFNLTGKEGDNIIEGVEIFT